MRHRGVTNVNVDVVANDANCNGEREREREREREIYRCDRGPNIQVVSGLGFGFLI